MGNLPIDEPQESDIELYRQFKELEENYNDFVATTDERERMREHQNIVYESYIHSLKENMLMLEKQIDTLWEMRKITTKELVAARNEELRHLPKGTTLPRIETLIEKETEVLMAHGIEEMKKKLKK